MIVWFGVMQIVATTTTMDAKIGVIFVDAQVSIHTETGLLNTYRLAVHLPQHPPAL